MVTLPASVANQNSFAASTNTPPPKSNTRIRFDVNQVPFTPKQQTMATNVNIGGPSANNNNHNSNNVSTNGGNISGGLFQK